MDSTEADRCLRGALSALQGLFSSLVSYLEKTLQLLEPHVSREALRAFVLETRHELGQLAAYCTGGDMYVEVLTLPESSDKAVNLEVEGSWGIAAQSQRD